MSYTYAISPKLLNEARFGFTNVTTSVGFGIEGAAALQQLDLQGVDISQHPTTHAFPTFNFSAGTGFTPIGRDKAGITQSKTMQFSDNVTYTLGKHTLKGGLDVRRVRYFDLESFAPAFASDDFGFFTFQPTFTVMRLEIFWRARRLRWRSRCRARTWAGRRRSTACLRRMSSR